MTAPFTWPVTVRFKDLDAMGHAHHTLPLVYFEEARAALWRDLTGEAGLAAIDYVIAEATLRYHARILFPQTARVEIRVTNVGRSAFTLAYALRAESGDLLTEGRTVQVMFDYEGGRSKPLAPELRARLSALRGDG